jgi:hypothetical protein
MKSLSIATSAVIAVALACQSAQAQYGCCCNSGSVCEAYWSGYCANVMWPTIFVPPARRGVCETYAVMINNGWRRQNLLGDYHFEPETNQLTKAGELKVKWILTQAPPNRRSVFVQRAENEMQTASRVAAVHRLASSMSPAVGAIDVNDTHIVAEGHGAGAVDNMFVGFQANMPPPVLPPDTGSSSSSSSE